MRLTRLLVENFLSFDHFDLEPIAPGLTTIVGPNGSGKTNLVRVFELVALALGHVDEQQSQATRRAQPTQPSLASFAEARHHGAPEDRPIRVELGIELTNDAERAEVTTFVQAALLSALLARLPLGPGAAAWTLEEVTPERLDPLMSGAVVLEHRAPVGNPWEVAYEFSLGDNRYRWILAGRRSQRGITPVGNDGSGLPLWPTQVDLVQRLFPAFMAGAPDSSNALLSPFALERLCPGPGEIVEVLVQGSGGHFDPELEPFRRFAEMLGFHPPWAIPSRAFSLAFALRRVLDRGLALTSERLRGADLACRYLPFGTYSFDELDQAESGHDPSTLPLRLFALKNGDASQRERFARIRQTFEELAPGRRLDVSFEAIAPSGRSAQPAARPAINGSVPAHPPDRELAITVLIGEHGGAYHSFELPVELEGAGVWEALVLAEAVADSTDRVVVLDEPAVNLHPTWQRLLVEHVRAAPGQFVIITHSPYLVVLDRPDDLSSVVRLTRSNDRTNARRYEDASSDQNAAADLRLRIVRELAPSADARALLFAAGVVLLEGDTELGALPAWFERSETASRLGGPAQLSLGFFSVDGEQHFTPLLAFLVALGVPWAIVCDGGAFRPDTRKGNILRQFLEAGGGDDALARFIADLLAVGASDPTFTEVIGAARKQGIFTLASGWERARKAEGVGGDESFEAFVERVAPGKLCEAARDAGLSKVRRGRWLGENVPCPSEVDQLYGDILTSLGLSPDCNSTPLG
jgi:energy-coupling factor transporter ATP-binding protein EcfA2